LRCVAARRVNLSLITEGCRKAAFKSSRTIAERPADELLSVSKAAPESYAVKKKDDLERITKSNGEMIIGPDSSFNAMPWYKLELQNFTHFTAPRKRCRSH
jgi:hypothetical protein